MYCFTIGSSGLHQLKWVVQRHSKSRNALLVPITQRTEVTIVTRVRSISILHSYCVFYLRNIWGTSTATACYGRGTAESNLPLSLKGSWGTSSRSPWGSRLNPQRSHLARVIVPRGTYTASAPWGAESAQVNNTGKSGVSRPNSAHCWSHLLRFTSIQVERTCACKAGTYRL